MTKTAMPTMSESRNHVQLVGRLAAAAEGRELPSGDQLTTWRLVVDRAPDRRRKADGVRAVTIDTLDCFAWQAGVQRQAAAWQPGDVIALEGALRRRFWRGPQGPASRYEVEVVKAKRLAQASR